jgi:tetrahydromethanopterin S-methyltransferase subunit C
MIKDPKVNAAQPIDINELAGVITKSVATCILVYVGADTLRRVAIYAMTSKF